MEPRFDKDETVWVEIGNEEPKQFTIKGRNKSIAGIWMYSFYENNIACGEVYLRRNLTDPKLRLSECFDEDDPKVMFNTMAMRRGLPYINDDNRKDFKNIGLTFFMPDFDFVDWLKEYAGDRIIVDVGCGSGHLMKMLRARGARVMGIEPNINVQAVMEDRIKTGREIIHIMPREVSECAKFLNDLGEKALLIFARPCHNNFVQDGLNVRHPKQEALYITLEKNLTKYNDLGKYKKKAVKIEPRGSSAENEVVYSIKS